MKADVYSVVMLSLGALAIIVLGVLLVTDPMSFFVMALLLAVLGFILFYFGFINIGKSPQLLDITYTTAPTPEAQVSESTALPSSEIQPRTLAGPEVFHVSDNVFTYEEARAVCKAYESELASYSQIEQAYNLGAEWCGYGWSEGGLALFPTQESTWEKLQKEQDPSKRMECGRPGINGGYFDPSTHFGVNCYGIKPQQTIRDKGEDSGLQRLVGQIKDRIDKLLVDPFNAQEWSGSRRIVSSETDTGLAKNIKNVRGNVKDTASGIVEFTASLVSDVGNEITNVVKSII